MSQHRQHGFDSGYKDGLINANPFLRIIRKILRWINLYSLVPSQKKKWIAGYKEGFEKGKLRSRIKRQLLSKK